jgi:pyridoxamine 5'-phosphate oxidase
MNAGGDDRTQVWARLRREYAEGGLAAADLAPDPIEMFQRWFDDAVVADLSEPNAMIVATTDPDGQPSARTVLLKGVDETGFRFFTNLDSRKGLALTANPRCALLFPWHPLERQVRVEGTATELWRKEVVDYFRSRPRGSQLGAWASPQSEVVAGSRELDDRYSEVERRFAGHDEVPPPERWGGFRIRPETVEFWQGRPGRMHDRHLYRRTATGTWITQRLAP